MLKPMLPTLQFDVPKGSDWVYEIKYDGFRVILHWSNEGIELISRNGNRLNEQFPEVIEYCAQIYDKISPYLPILLDGEMCILDSPYKANFEAIQLRGRLKDKNKIISTMKVRQAHYLIFDLLTINGTRLIDKPLSERKQQLRSLFDKLGLTKETNNQSNQTLQMVDFTSDYDKLWETVTTFHGEGLIAKKKGSKWEAGKRTTNWYKLKNWQFGNFFISGYDKKNGFFHVAVTRNDKIFEVGLFSHGISSDEREALLQVIQANSSEESNTFMKVEPGICVELFYLELYKEQLRQPSFSRFRFDITWKDCTWEKLERKIPIPKEINITHPDKPLWKDKEISKQDYLHYLLAISPYMLPFLENRLLTVIRYPHGMYGEAFYQKNCPDYAPEFIKTFLHEGIDYIVCNDTRTLAWLGNQLAFEFHIPFQTIYSTGPSEIVFDLDPPSRNEFPLAIKAALILKEVFKGLKLISFIKLSGNKGLQIYIPLPENTFTFEDTRQFTEFIAHYLVTSEPDYFTTERLKKNRNNKLYVDYVQHAAGKTIIAPYSVRGNEGAYVATPLYWDEVTEDLSIEGFSMDTIIDRISKKGCPFQDYFQAKTQQQFEPVLEFLQNNQTL